VRSRRTRDAGWEEIVAGIDRRAVRRRARGGYQVRRIPPRGLDQERLSMNTTNRNRMLMIAAGACMGLASMAVAQGGGAGNGGVVNVSGATLLENWSRSVASTADYIDADGDGIAGWLGTNLDGVPFGRADQLAVGSFSGQFDVAGRETQHFVIQYRVVGSTNGFVELLNFGGPAFVTDTAGDILTIDANNNGLLDAGDAFTDINGDGIFQAFNAVSFAGAAQVSGTGLNSTNRGRASTAYNNRTAYIGSAAIPGTFPGVRTGAYNQGNPGGAPNRSVTTPGPNFLRATFSASTDAPSTGGLRIDVAPLDVATFLAVRKEPVGFVPFWSRSPADSGYGANPRTSLNKDGTVAGFDNKLPLLTGGRQFNEPFTDTNNNGVRDAGESFIDANQNGVYDAPVLNQTIFDTPLLFAPIALVTNYGTGLTQIRMSQTQHLLVTGRMPSGENLIVVTRDKGSGTRNAFDNVHGVDPSWGNGENIGLQSNTANQHQPGALFIPSNKGSNGGVETTVINTRLAVGYVGTERGVTGSGDGSWLVKTSDSFGQNQELEIVNTINDIYPGNSGAAVRPTLTNLLNNNVNGWIIGGEAVLATIGDPLANGAINGGTGWAGAFDPFEDLNNNGTYELGEPFTDLNGNGVRNATNAEAGLVNGNPPMQNVFAAQYLNNISRSIAAFDNVPSGAENIFMPGEFAASQFLSLAALDFAKSTADYTSIFPNPALNPRVKNYIASGAAGNVHSNPAFASFNTAGRGIVPRRLTGATYSDGVTGTNNWYINEKATSAPNFDQNRIIYGALTGATALHPRNKIAGDFNGTGARDAGDVVEMLKAFRQRQVGEASFNWIPLDGIYGAGSGLEASIEILGDFNADGNFNSADVRYFADGLFLVAGALDRKAGFTRVDTDWATIVAGNFNFFGTTLANPLAAYDAGDSRADVTNASSRATPGFAPIADNAINAFDIDYVYRQFQTQGRTVAVFGITDGQANWSNLDEAAYFDLSADLNGDLAVDQADICEILDILETTYGDVNLNGVVDAADEAIITANLGTAGGWARGDMNGDGQVTSDDLGFAFCCETNTPGPCSSCPTCPADFDQDGGVTGADVEAFFAAFEAGDACGDTDLDGGVTGADVEAFFAAFEAGGC
jgi:hypothetical protein